jgi:hypothetical protein
MSIFIHGADVCKQIVVIFLPDATQRNPTQPYATLCYSTLLYATQRYTTRHYSDAQMAVNDDSILDSKRVTITEKFPCSYLWTFFDV